MKDSLSVSWVVHVSSLLYPYDSALDVLTTTSTTYIRRIEEKNRLLLPSESIDWKSYLGKLGTSELLATFLHVMGQRDILQACVKAKIIAGTYVGFSLTKSEENKAIQTVSISTCQKEKKCSGFYLSDANPPRV